MKNMKRFLAFGMAACMVMGSMTACGSGKSDSGSSDAATVALLILPEITEK